MERELDSPPAEAEAHAVCTQIVSSDVRGGSKSDLDDLRESLKSELRDELAAQLKTLSSKLVEELRNQSPYVAPVASQSAIPGTRQAPPPVRRQRPPPSTMNYQWDVHGRPICLDCGEAGHIQRYCPRRGQPKGF